MDAWNVIFDSHETLEDNIYSGGYGILQNKENYEAGARQYALFNFRCRSDCLDFLGFICPIVIIISAY